MHWNEKVHNEHNSVSTRLRINLLLHSPWNVHSAWNSRVVKVASSEQRTSIKRQQGRERENERERQTKKRKTKNEEKEIAETLETNTNKKKRKREKAKKREKKKETREEGRNSTIVRRFYDKARTFERWENVARASRIDVCATERRSIRQRWRRHRPRPRWLRLWLWLRPRRRERRQHRRRSWRREVSFGCTGARLSIWEPTLPFLLLSSTAPHPSATAAAAAAALEPAASRPNPRNADTSAPTSLGIFLLTLSFRIFLIPSISFFLPLARSQFFVRPFPIALSASFFPRLPFGASNFLILSSSVVRSVHTYSVVISKGRCSSFFSSTTPTPFFFRSRYPYHPFATILSFVRSFFLSSSSCSGWRAPGVPVMWIMKGLEVE